MDSDLDDILNDDPIAPAAPSAAPSATASAQASTKETSAPDPSKPEGEKEPSQEPKIVEAAPTSTESAVLVPVPESVADSKDVTSEDDTSPSGVTPVPADTAEKPPAASTSVTATDNVTSVSANKPKEEIPPPPTERPTNTGGDDDGWGLSAVTAALGGWGFGGSHEEADDTAQPIALGSVESDPVEEEDWKHQAEAVEGAAAAAVAFLTGSGPSATTAAEGVEEAMEEAAHAASAAASSFFSGATQFLSGGGEDATATSTSSNAAAPPPDAGDPTASALRALSELNPMNKLASGWIDDLERENTAADPHRELRAHLDNHLQDWPRSTYEEWVEEALCALEGWDQGSAVVDDTFYSEGSVHRNIWNETNYQRAEEDGGEAQREFVPARAAGTTGGSKAQPVKNVSVGEVPAAGGADDDADLDGLIGEEEIVFVENAETLAEK